MVLKTFLTNELKMNVLKIIPLTSKLHFTIISFFTKNYVVKKYENVIFLFKEDNNFFF